MILTQYESQLIKNENIIEDDVNDLIISDEKNTDFNC